MKFEINSKYSIGDKIIYYSGYECYMGIITNVRYSPVRDKIMFLYEIKNPIYESKLLDQDDNYTKNGKSLNENYCVLYNDKFKYLIDEMKILSNTYKKIEEENSKKWSEFNLIMEKICDSQNKCSTRIFKIREDLGIQEELE